MLFITSLAGIGYVAPEELARTVEFSPGTPVFDLAGRQAMERRMQEQKALENEWAKKKRPKDVSIVLVSLCRHRTPFTPSSSHACFADPLRLPFPLIIISVTLLHCLLRWTGQLPGGISPN